MTHDIHRIIVRAKPAAHNTEYFEWQTAQLCLLVRDNDRPRADTTARDELRRRHWEFLDYVSKSTLIEERVRAEGGEVWDAYLHAKQRGVFVKVFPEHFGAGRDGPPLIRPARVNESFITKVIADAGGSRVVADDSIQHTFNADYLVGTFIFELKDLQEEAQEKTPHQEKLAALFAPYSRGLDAISLDPTLLSKADFRQYLDILGGPIKSHVKKASKQIKSTRALLGRPELRGGLILLNTGFASYPHDLFAEQVTRYAHKDSRQFDAVICATIWMETNGFDSYIYYRLAPHDAESPEVAAIRRAFDERFKQMMTDLMRNQLPAEADRVQPRRAIAFTVNGVDFSWQPPKVPFHRR